MISTTWGDLTGSWWAMRRELKIKSRNFSCSIFLLLLLLLRRTAESVISAGAELITPGMPAPPKVDTFLNIHTLFVTYILFFFIEFNWPRDCQLAHFGYIVLLHIFVKEFVDLGIYVNPAFSNITFLMVHVSVSLNIVWLGSMFMKDQNTYIHESFATTLF